MREEKEFIYLNTDIFQIYTLNIFQIYNIIYIFVSDS